MSCMGTRTILAPLSVMLVLSVVGSRSHAAKLVVMAVNSGSDITAPYENQPPLLTPGAKGFLLGIDTEDGDAAFALGVQNIHIVGPGLINRLVQASNEELLSSYPKILVRTE